MQNSWSVMHWRNIYWTRHSAPLKFFAGATESGGEMGACIFGNILPIKVQNCYGGKIYFFDPNNSNFSEYNYLEPGLYHSNTDIVETTNTLIQDRHNHRETSIAVKVSRRTQKMRFTSQLKNWVLHFSVRTWVTNLEALLAMTLEYCRGKGPHKPVFAYDIVRINIVS